MKYFFSPGRVNLMGEHLDYNGGCVVPVCIDLGIYATVTIRNDCQIKVSSKNYNSKKFFIIELDNDIRPSNNWVDYVKAVIYELVKIYKFNHGLNIELYGTLPIASGLSSSASLEILICFIFDYYFELNLSKLDMALICKCAENDFVGVECGLMDQLTIASGIRDHALIINCKNFDVKYQKLDLAKYSLVILDTCKKRSLINSQYNNRIKECQKIKSQFKSLYNIVDLNYDDLIKLDYSKQKRCKHILFEQKLATMFVNYLKNSEYSKASLLMLKSHYSLKYDYEVSCNELDYMVEIAIKNGAIGAKMTGAGFGGCAIAIVNKSNVNEFIDNVKFDYKKISKIEANIYQVSVVGGVCCVDSIPYK